LALSLQLELALVEYVSWFNHERRTNLSATSFPSSSRTYRFERKLN